MNDVPRLNGDSTKAWPHPAASEADDFTTAEWLERVHEIGPILEEEAPVADRITKLSDRAMDALHKHKMIRLLSPRSLDGAEMSLPQFFHVVEAVGRYDGSAAWCVCQGNACAMLAAYLDAPVAEEMWGDDPRAVLSWGPGKAEARAVEGGYSVTASTAFASGSHHATWLAAHCMTVLEEDGTRRVDERGVPENRTILIPATAIELSDKWDPIGLRGTGSDGFTVENMFVPEEHTIVRGTMVEEKPRRSSLHSVPLMTVYPTGFAATAIGIARGFLKAFIALAHEKKPRNISVALKDQPVVQDEVARCEARLSAATAFVLAAAEEGWQEILTNDQMTVEQRIRIRLAGTFAIHEAKAVVDMLYDTAGTSGIFSTSPFERRFRDIHTVALQIQARKAHFEAVGAWMFGHEVDAETMSVI